MHHDSIKKLTLAGILSAATVLLTAVVSIPIPGGIGYFNLGDAGVLLSAALLGSPWGILCGAVSSALSDLLLGYALYAPATCIIKGCMAALFLLLHERLSSKRKPVSYYLAALCVPLGYFLYEAILYGADAAIPNVAINLLQGIVGATVALLLHRVFRGLHL